MVDDLISLTKITVVTTIFILGSALAGSSSLALW